MNLFNRLFGRKQETIELENPIADLGELVGNRAEFSNPDLPSRGIDLPQIMPWECTEEHVEMVHRYYVDSIESYLASKKDFYLSNHLYKT